jgi:hypothetical protein
VSATDDAGFSPGSQAHGLQTLSYGIITSNILNYRAFSNSELGKI